MHSICLLLAVARISVTPVAPDATLSRPDAEAINAALRAGVSDAGAELAPAGGDVRRLLESGAIDGALVGKPGRVEGATTLAIALYRKGSQRPVSVVRAAGIGAERVAQDVREKVRALLGGPPPQAARASSPQPPGPPPVDARPSAPAPAPPPREAEPAAPRPPPPADAQTTDAGGLQIRTQRAQSDAELSSPLVALVRETLGDVEALRGLKRKRDLRVEVLDDEAFARAVREKATQELTPQIVEQERARWAAFALAPPDVDPGKVMLSVLDEQVAGFYDPLRKVLVVRREPPASASAMGPDGLRLVLAHEIEHALQDQNFGIPDLRKLSDDDERLALTALYEGDAMAVMTAYGARRAGRPVKAALISGATALAALDTAVLLRMSGKSPALEAAPPILREELVLPYSAGFALVAEVFRRGGLALVNRMFAHPPRTSHQVLHPEAYLAGEQPVQLAPPPAPAGARVLAQGRMGELGTRVALEACVDRAVVKDLAPRWQGDAYTVAQLPNGKLALLWSTAWSGSGAAPIANAMRMQTPCWEESADPRLAPNGRVEARGARVALERGLPDDAGARAAKAMAETPAAAAPAPAPPLGNVPAPAAAAPARVEAGRVIVPRLGLEGAAPEGFAPDTPPGVEIALRRIGSGGVTLAFVPEALSGEALDAFFESAAAAIAREVSEGASLRATDRQPVKLLGAAGEERAFEVPRGGLTVRIDTVPYCGGRATVALLRVEATEKVRAVFDRFAASLHAQPGAPPGCEELE